VNPFIHRWAICTSMLGRSVDLRSSQQGNLFMQTGCFGNVNRTCMLRRLVIEGGDLRPARKGSICGSPARP
jgi:hypothetical protein